MIINTILYDDYIIILCMHIPFTKLGITFNIK